MSWPPLMGALQSEAINLSQPPPGCQPSPVGRLVPVCIEALLRASQRAGVQKPRLREARCTLKQLVACYTIPRPDRAAGVGGGIVMGVQLRHGTGTTPS